MLHLILARLVRHGGMLFTHQQPNQQELRHQITHILHVWRVGVWLHTSPVLIVRLYLRTACILHCYHWTKLSLTELQGSRGVVAVITLTLLPGLWMTLRDQQHLSLLPKTQPEDRMTNVRPLNSQIHTPWIVQNTDTHECVLEHYCTCTRNRWVVSRRKGFVWHVGCFGDRQSCICGCEGVCDRIARGTASCPEGRE